MAAPPIFKIPAHLPRKLSKWDQEKQARSLARVHPACQEIWKAGIKKGRQDTFIGLVELDTMTLFLAPCFGIRHRDVPRDKDAALFEDLGIPDPNGKMVPDPFRAAAADYAIAERIKKNDFPKDMTVVSSNTSLSDRFEEWKKGELEKVYGAGNVCLVWLGPEFDTKFDGKSHRALGRWLNNKGWTSDTIVKDANWWTRSLGFAIQKDKDGWFIRFASSLNERWGQETGSDKGTFEPRNPKPIFDTRFNPLTLEIEQTQKIKYQDRESRDLPKQWALFIEDILARDLGLALHKPKNTSFERMQSHQEHQTTKFTRFTPNKLV